MNFKRIVFVVFFLACFAAFLLNPQKQPNLYAQVATGTPTCGSIPCAALNLTVNRLEVSQATQRLDQSVPLVANRPAVVRLFLNVSISPTTASVPWGVTGALHVLRNGTELAGSPLSPINSGGSFRPPLNADREQLNHSLNFMLPAAWQSAGSLTMWAEVNPQRSVFETNYNDNRGSDLQIAFNAVTEMQVRLVPIRYRSTFSNKTYEAPALNNGNQFGLSGVQQMYPISGIRYTIAPPLEFKGDLSKHSDWLKLIELLQRVRQTERPNQPIMAASNVLPKYYGVLPQLPTSEQAVWDGLGQRPGAISVGVVNGANVAAHELGHNLGRRHAPCGNVANVDPQYPYAAGVIGETGLDPYNPRTFASTEYKDMMGYCQPKWISDYTYRGLYDVLATAGLVQAASEDGIIAPKAETALQPALLVSGRITATSLGTADLPSGGLLYNARPIPEAEVVQLPGSGAYRIDLVDSNNQITSYFFDPVVVESHNNEPPAYHFAFALPAVSGLQKVQLKQGVTLLSELTAAAQPPSLSASLSVTSTTLVTATWQATSSDGSTPQVMLRYSPDGGATWIVIAADLVGNSYQINKAQLPASANGLLEIVATNSTQSASQRLNLGPIGNHSPEASMVGQSPWWVESGQLFSLAGSAVDLEDGTIGESKLSWYVNGAKVASGSTLLLASPLPDGIHIVKLVAVDSANAVAEVSALVFVGRGGGNVYLPIGRR